ncbi:Cyclin B [Phytophthora nicotianae]|uniref:Cyclin B n=1 Tax=Phytophthora nicotianae TaxID=4792 RepID=A0A0W8BXE8_PHYNI|nr:Cyclin B [Phytophthora nicotianae]
MSFTRRSIRINNENEMPADLASSRPGKRQILRDAQDAGNPEKRPRFMKSQSSTTTGGPRRTALGDVTNRRSALGDVTNRINIKKASVSSMSSSVTNAGALAKKKVIASKRSLSNINIGSRTLNTANASKRNLSNVNLISRHVSSMTSSTSSLSSRSSSSIISRMSRPLPSTTNTLGSLGLQDKISPSVNIIPPTPEENEHDIDSEDRNDPTACWQYAEDITKYHLETEKKRKPSSSYMSRQSDINAKMRAILVDWLVDVHYKYGLLPQTLHIAVMLIDQYLEKSLSVGRQRLQLIGVSAMFIAAKYEEIYPPEAEDFVKITDNAYTREEVFQMEAKMLATIGYRVTFPTAYQFMKRFIKASRTCDDRVEHFAHYVVDRSLQEYKLMKFLPSTIAASAVYIARTQMRDTPAWSSTLEYHSSYSERSLTPCIDELKEMIWNAHNGVGKLHKLTAARRKFSKERFMAVAAGSLAFSKSA